MNTRPRHCSGWVAEPLFRVLGRVRFQHPRMPICVEFVFSNVTEKWSLTMKNHGTETENDVTFNSCQTAFAGTSDFEFAIDPQHRNVFGICFFTCIWTKRR